MKQGFFFTFTAIALFSLLLYLAANYLLASQPSGQLVDLSLARKVSYAWDDVNEDLKSVVNLTIYQSGSNLTIEDSLPAAHDLGQSLVSYWLFVQNYYKTPDLNYSVLGPDGQEMTLGQLGPPLRVLPYGINYSYPDYGKNELFLQIPSSNFSGLSSLALNYSLPGHWFQDNLNNNCGMWNPLKTCNGGTQHCLNLSVWIRDKNGSAYNNSGCTQLDADDNSNLQLNLNYSDGTNAWIKILVGKLPDLLHVQLQNTNVSTNTTLTLNSTPFSVGYPAKLRVLDPGFNASRTAEPKS